MASVNVPFNPVTRLRGNVETTYLYKWRCFSDTHAANCDVEGKPLTMRLRPGMVSKRYYQTEREANDAYMNHYYKFHSIHKEEGDGSND